MQNVCQKAVTVKRIVFPREGKKRKKKTLFDIKNGIVRFTSLSNRDPLLVHETINYYVQSKL